MGVPPLILVQQGLIVLYFVLVRQEYWTECLVPWSDPYFLLCIEDPKTVEMEEELGKLSWLLWQNEQVLPIASVMITIRKH